MWTRRELKECAKQLLKINYWKAVLAGVILSPDWRFRSGLGSRKVFFRKF